MSRDTRTIDATFVRADTSPDVAGSMTAVGAPWVDFEGSHWKINSNRIYGVAFANDGVKACCYHDSGNIREGAVKVDVDAFNLGALLRFSAASGGTGYAVGFNDLTNFTVYKCVAGTQTKPLDNTNWGADFATPSNPQIEFQVRDASASTVVVTTLIRSKDTPTVTYGLKQCFDASSPIQATGRAGVATYFNGVYGGGGATRVQLLSQTVTTEISRFGFLNIGDSITAGVGTNAGNCLDSAGCAEILAIKTYDQGDQFVAWQNSAIAGTKTTDWVNNTSGANIEAVVATALAKGINTAQVMLGINDAQVSFLSATTYKANLQIIVNRLLAAGMTKVILNQLIYNNNPAHTAGEHTTCIGLIQQYSTAMDEVADATVGCYRGDRTIYATTSGSWVTYDSGDGIHPNQVGHTLIGTRQATAWQIIRQGATITQGSVNSGDTISGTFLGGGSAIPTAAYLSTDGRVSNGIALSNLSVQSNAGVWSGDIPATTPAGVYYVVMVPPTIVSTTTVNVANKVGYTYGQHVVPADQLALLPSSIRDADTSMLVQV